MTYKGKYMVLYSPEQRCFHIDDAEREMQRNLVMLLERGDAPDYLTLGIFDTREEADYHAVFWSTQIPGVRSVASEEELDFYKNKLLEKRAQQ